MSGGREEGREERGREGRSRVGRREGGWEGRWEELRKSM